MRSMTLSGRLSEPSLVADPTPHSIMSRGEAPSVWETRLAQAHRQAAAVFEPGVQEVLLDVCRRNIGNEGHHLCCELTCLLSLPAEPVRRRSHDVRDRMPGTLLRGVAGRSSSL